MNIFKNNNNLDFIKADDKTLLLIGKWLNTISYDINKITTKEKK